MSDFIKVGIYLKILSNISIKKQNKNKKYNMSKPGVFRLCGI